MSLRVRGIILILENVSPGINVSLGSGDNDDKKNFSPGLGDNLYNKKCLSMFWVINVSPVSGG